MIFSLKLRLNTLIRNPALDFEKNVREYSATDQKLRETIGRYLEQIGLISQGKPHGSVDTILSGDCKKILNGKLISSSREAFIEELETIHKALGDWTVVPKRMVCSPQDRTVVLSLEVALNQKTYLATVFFHFNPQNLISSLEETFVEANGSYQLDGGQL